LSDLVLSTRAPWSAAPGDHPHIPQLRWQLRATYGTVAHWPDPTRSEHHTSRFVSAHTADELAFSSLPLLPDSLPPLSWLQVRTSGTRTHITAPPAPSTPTELLQPQRCTLSDHTPCSLRRTYCRSQVARSVSWLPLGSKPLLQKRGGSSSRTLMPLARNQQGGRGAEGESGRGRGG